MRISTSIVLASLLHLGLTQSLDAVSGTEVPDAGTESRALAAHLADEYTDYLRDYIHVFVGYQVCAYAFIDEDVLNALADDSLRSMTRKAAALIREAHPDTRSLSQGAVHYAASMAVLTTVEMWANGITAEIAPRYQAEGFACADSIQANRDRYEAIRAFVSAPQRTTE